MFAYQYTHNNIYRQWIELTKGSQEQVNRFLPIAFFKYLDIKSGDWASAQLFRSSGTGDLQRSTHHIRDLAWYNRVTAFIWQSYWPELKSFEFLGLLPNYMENPHSSLIAMVRHFMDNSRHGAHLFYDDDFVALYDKLESNRMAGIPTVLFGVSFALLDYGLNHCHEDLAQTIIIETGGMKKFKKELSREELHGELRGTFNGARICSEYGMAECTSQLYSLEGGFFRSNSLMKIVVTDPTDPFKECVVGQKGRINIIDLANIDTCSFIATDDLGSIDDQGNIRILGRLDHADLRGCNYL